MTKGQTSGKESKLSLIEAFRFFLKGNKLFALNGIVLYILNSTGKLFPPLLQQVYTDNIITHKNPEWFTPLIIFYSILFVGKLVVWITFSLLSRASQAKISVTTSSNYLWTVLRLPMTLLSQFSPGELVARYTTIPKAIKMIDHSMPIVAFAFFPFVCCYLVMLYSWKLGLLEIFSILLLVYVMRSTASRQKKLAMDLEVTEARLQNVTMTGMGNLDTIKALGGEQYFYAQWETAYAQSMNARAKTTTISVYLGALPVLVLEFTNGAILCLGTWLILQGEMTPGMILASQGLINTSIFPINKAIECVQTLLGLNSSIQRIKDVSDCGEDCADLKLAADDELPDEAKLTGEIELRDVTFGYDRNLPPIISHFSLKIKPGERIALVGPSGCGKSTILSLVSGLYEPWEGEVLFDGKPRKKIDRMTFVNSVSVVNQDVTLFEGTIADNVKMWDDSIEDFAMVLACRDAQIHHEVMERPGAYQGTVAERGKNFSGGQRQRIEIATALAKEPTILLMDEGTSALDPKAEAKVMEHLYDMGITFITIAHRLETIVQCDQIYVIEHGRITQHGTHDELSQMDGLYRNLLKYA